MSLINPLEQAGRGGWQMPREKQPGDRRKAFALAATEAEALAEVDFAHLLATLTVRPQPGDLPDDLPASEPSARLSVAFYSAHQPDAFELPTPGAQLDWKV